MAFILYVFVLFWLCGLRERLLFSRQHMDFSQGRQHSLPYWFSFRKCFWYRCSFLYPNFFGALYFEAFLWCAAFTPGVSMLWLDLYSARATSYLQALCSVGPGMAAVQEAAMMLATHTTFGQALARQVPTLIRHIYLRGYYTIQPLLLPVPIRCAVFWPCLLYLS